MSIISSSYIPPLIFKNAHINTVYKTLFYNNKIAYKRVRIHTPDEDFLDLDFSFTNSETLVIASHGLEGSSNSKYIVSLATYLKSVQIDCLAINFRGCSGEDNHQLYSYNSGKTDDLETVIQYVLNNYNYKNIILVGYSMGGNITLKYLGENKEIPKELKGACTISVPTDLEGSSNTLNHWQNTVYMQRFLRTLKKKGIHKYEKFPNSILNKQNILNAKNFTDFDDAFTAPLFGYKNAQDYWTKCSSKQYISSIKTPTLIINALDDTFLSKSCFPINECKNHKLVHLEMPNYGGHVGFNSSPLKKDVLWSENRVYQFINYFIS